MRVCWADYDNDGYLDLATGNAFATGNIIFKNNGNETFTSTWRMPKANYTISLSLGDIDNDDDLDIAEGNTNTYSKIHMSLEADYGATNTAPSIPDTNLTSSLVNGQLELRWDKADDTETVSAEGLYYDIRVATETISDGLAKWIVSPSTGAGAANFGNYIHGFPAGAPAQAGINLSNGLLEDTSYFWQVRTIDTGLKKSAWSVEQSTYIPNASPTVPDMNTPLDNTTTNQTTISFNWNASTDNASGVELYELILSSSPSLTSPLYSSSTVTTGAALDVVEKLYYWGVRAKDYAGNYSAYSSTWAIIVDTTPPVSAGFTDVYAQSPTVIITTATASDALSGLSAAPYYISAATYTAADKYNSGWVVSSHTWTGLTPNTTHYFKVKAKDIAGNESSYSTVRATLTYANAPVSSYIMWRTSYSIRIGWSDNNNPSDTVWGIIRSSNNFLTSTTTLKVFINGYTPTSYTDIPLAFDTTYYYKVKAYNRNGIESAYDVTISTLTQLSPPPCPSDFAGTVLSTTSIKWLWTDNTVMETAYIIRTDTGGILANLAENTTYWVEKNLSPNVQAQRRIEAYNVYGSSFSGYSSRYTFANVPDPATIDDVTAFNISFSWSDNSNAAGTIYEVSRSTDNFTLNFSTPVKKSDNRTFAYYNDMTVLSPNTYWYRIRAYNGEDTPTDFSNIISTYAAGAYSISGYVKDLNSEGVINTTVTLSGTDSRAALTDTSGYYNFSGLGAGSYTVTPAKEGWVLAPEDLAVTLLGGPPEYPWNNTGNNFTASPKSAVSVDTSVEKEITVLPNSGEVKVTIPANTFTENVQVTVAVPASVEAIPAAQNDIIPLTNVIAVEITNDKSLQPGKEVTLVFSYRDSDITGHIESVLKVARYDSVNNRWLQLDSTVDAAQNKITCYTGHFSKFQVVALVAAANLSQAKVYPNPFNLSSSDKVTFGMITAGAKVKIFTLSGQLVISLEDTDNNGQVEWTGKNASGTPVVSGVYLCLVTDEAESQMFLDENKTLRLLVIQ
jgi:hypothetical protein